MKLTDRFVKTVQPGAERTLYWDEVQKGFALAVEPSGHTSYKLIYSFGGRPRWYAIADARAIGLAEVRDIARTKMADVVKGTDVQAEKRASLRAGTFEELATRYREEFAQRRNKSWEQADSLVRKYLTPTWGKLRAHDVTRGDIRAVFHKLTDSGAPVLANQVLAAASAIFSWGIKQEIGDFSVNPCHGIERNPTKDRERVLSDHELPTFWTAFDDLDLVRRAALRMILLTGQRPGEVVHMRREHIDVGRHRFTDANGRRLEVQGGWWTLPGEPDPALGWPGTKNAQTHRVWLPQPTLAILDELDSGRGGFVFAGSRGQAITGLGNAMQHVCKKVGIVKPDKVTPHDLRRTHGTTVTSLGFTRDQMNRLQNHKEGGIGSVYDRHSYAEENRRIQEAVADRIVTLVVGEQRKIISFRQN